MGLETQRTDNYTFTYGTFVCNTINIGTIISKEDRGLLAPPPAPASYYGQTLCLLSFH